MSFAQSYALTVSPAVEGGYSCVSTDPGNWTGGAVNDGQLLGTNCGVSAAFLWSLPSTAKYYQADPKSLQTADLQEIYETYFWDAISASALPASVAGLLFDGAVNQGVGFATKALQAAVGATTDGIIGPKTLAAAKAANPTALHAEIGRLRDESYRADDDWSTFGVGWTRRLMTVVAATASFT